MNRSAGRPYPGARPFRSSEKGRFFGRAAEAEDLADLWRANHLTILYGGTGVGKSSLLFAGVIPLSEQDHLNALEPGRLLQGWTYPRAALPDHNPYTLSLLRSWSPGETATSLTGMTIRQFVSRRAERQNGIVYALVDQAEELFVSSEAHRRMRSHQFMDELADALQAQRMHLLLAVREPALDIFMAKLGGGIRYELKPFDADQALDAVVKPMTAQSDRSFAAGVAEDLVRDMMTSTVQLVGGQERVVNLDRVEPEVLQVACSKLWESLPSHQDVITEHDVRNCGDVNAALAVHYGHLVASVAASHGQSTAHMLTWLIRTFVTEKGTRGLACEGLTDTAGMPNPVLRALEDCHILTTERRSGGTWYQLLSDRLIGPLQRATILPPLPAEPRECLRMAGRALALGEFGLTQRWADEALRATPSHDWRSQAEVHSLLGNLAFERDRPEEAEKQYRTASRLLEVVRDTGAVAVQLAAVGQMLLARGRLADALDELRAASDRVPNDLTVQTELGGALWSMGQRRAAVAVLTSVLAIDGGDTEALRLRGEILADLGDARDALRDLDRVVELERPSTRAARGLARAELGDPGADKEIEGALEDAPRNGAVLLYAARAKALTGDKAAATKLAQHALEATDPALPQHQRAVALELVGLTSLDHHQ